MFPWLLSTFALPHTYRFYFTLLSRCQPCTPTLLSLQLSFVLYSLLFRYVFKPSTYHLVPHLDLFVVGTRYVLSFVLDTNINFVVGTSICLCLSQLPLPLCVNTLPSFASLWQTQFWPIQWQAPVSKVFCLIGCLLWCLWQWTCMQQVWLCGKHG